MRVIPSSWQELAHAALFFGLLLWFQYVLPADVQYSSYSYLAFFGQLHVFLGIGFGQIAAFLIERLRGKVVVLNFQNLGLWTLFCVTLHVIFPAQGWIFSVCAFAGFGFYIGSLYSQTEVRKAVIAATAIGILASLSFNWFSQVDTRWLKLGGFALFFIADFVMRKRIGWLSGCVFVAAIAIFATDLHRLRPRVFDLRGGEFSFVGEPKFSPLLRTEIVLDAKTGSYFVMTNGARLAFIPTKPSSNRELTSAVESLGEAAKEARALIIGSAGGRNVRVLLDTQIGEIVANDINPQVFEIVKGSFGEATANTYTDPRVKIVAMDARRLLATDETLYDIIFVETLSTGARAGAFSGLVEASMYTLEAFEDMYRRLKPGGKIIFSEYKAQFGVQPSRDSFVSRMQSTLGCSNAFSGAEIFKSPANLTKELPAFFQHTLGSERDIMTIRRPIEGERINGHVVKTPSDCAESITDDRPYFFNLQFEYNYMKKVLIVGCAIMILLLVSISRLSQLPASHATALVGSGAAYTMGISALSGMVAFHLGSPFHVTPFILALSFSMGFVAYMLFRTVVRTRVPAMVVISVLGIISIALLIAGTWTGLENLFLKMTVLAVLSAIPMFLLEAPFLYFLRMSDKRSDVVAYENVGAIVGVLAATVSRGLVAYSNLFILSVAIAVFASVYAIRLARTEP